MRGRKPRLITITPADLVIRQQVARSESLPWYQARRARILLANARGEPNCTLASRMQCDEATMDTADYLRGCDGWWRPRLTPARASWLNRAELLNNAFDGRYLKRGSRCSREEYIAHVAACWPECNRHYAHPFAWTWTNQKMRTWFAEHAA